MKLALELEGIGKDFGGVRALDRVSIAVEEGAIHGLIGPNGAGKTTIFNNITGIYAPSEGRIIFMGRDITGEKPFRIARLGIGRTFQNIRLFSNLPVLENIILACNQDLTYSLLDALIRGPKYKRQERAAREQALSLLGAVGLTDKRDERANNLPYGYQRRLEIARALALRPKLLLLDEPAAGMNAEESLELVGFIRDIREKFAITILMIEHHMDVVTGLCDQVTVLNFGRVIAQGNPAEIKRDSRVIEAYLGSGGAHA